MKRAKNHAGGVAFVALVGVVLKPSGVRNTGDVLDFT